MRRQYFWWTYLVAGIVFSAYGGYSLIYSQSKGKEIPVLGLVMFIIGVLMLVLFLVLYLVSLFAKRKQNKAEPTVVEAKPKEEKKEEVKEVELPKQETPKIQKERDYEYVSNKPHRSIDYDVNAYVNKVGYGPVLRVDGNRIVDMRNNTYYRIEGNIIKMEGYGPVYEISGNNIKKSFGSYLFELSGSNINKTFGGFYASISGNYITTYDGKEKYEMTNSLPRMYVLAIVAILFGE